jgi:hypothetical protein
LASTQGKVQTKPEPELLFRYATHLRY